MDQRQVSLPRNPASGGSVSRKSPKAGALLARKEASLSLSLSVGSGLKVAGSCLLLEPLPRSVDAETLHRSQDCREGRRRTGGAAAGRTGQKDRSPTCLQVISSFRRQETSLKPASTHQREWGGRGRCALQPRAWLWRPLVVLWSFCNFKSSFLGIL